MMASAGMAISILAGKTKYLFVALKLTKAAPAVSMVLTSFAYSFFFGWPYAVGMVGLIFFHECGHALVMKKYGVPFSPMVFIPFMGAVIAMKEEPRNAYEEAMIAFGGPVMGTVAALGAGTAGVMTDSQLLLALADFGYMVNLFNLLPLGSMDGGRITNAVSPYFGVVGVASGGALIYASAVHNPLFYLILLGGTYSTAARIFGWEEKANKDYYRIPRTQQGGIMIGYLGLVAILLVAMNANNEKRKTPKQLEREKMYGGSEDPWAVGRGSNQGDGVYDDYFK
jgi:Zn-dependent protease